MEGRDAVGSACDDRVFANGGESVACVHERCFVHDVDTYTDAGFSVVWYERGESCELSDATA